MKRKLKYILLILSTALIVSLSSACAVKDKLEQLKCEKHDYGVVATSIEREATCMEKGQELWTCIHCGYEYIKETPMLDHVHDGGVQTRSPTCSVAGEMTYTCIDCGTKKVESIDTLPHERVDVDMVLSTCTQKGYMAYAYCGDCNAVIVPKRDIPPLGHSPVVIVGKAATCTEAGLRSGERCSLCDEILKEQQEIPARGHTIVIDNAVMAECSKSGLTAGSHCSSCDLVIKQQEVLPALEHDYGDGGTICNICGEHKHVYAQTEAIAPTCTSAGKTASTYCISCTMILSPVEIIPAKGHTMVDGVCIDCGIEHEHTIVVDEAVAATCTSTGLSEGTHCGDCGKVILAQEVIGMKAHSLNYITIPASWYCTVCNQTFWTKPE